jgi:hypothetical protein
MYFNGKYQMVTKHSGGRDSSVGIATGYGLDGPGIDWITLYYLLVLIRYSGIKTIPVETRFFAHVQTGPMAHPASCTMGTGSFPGIKAAWAWCWPRTPSNAEVTKEKSYTSTPPQGLL